VRRGPRVRLLAVAALALAACGGPSPAERASSAGIRIVRFVLHSKLVGRDLPEIGVVPAEAAGRTPPMLVFLHGRHGTPDSGLNAAITMITVTRATAPAVVLANGGPDSYWHDRGSGRWGSSVVKELIPLAARLLRADASRVAIGGISMGGFGALDIARLWPERFCAVGGHSAAVWPTAGQTNPVAFDGPQDFARHDVMRYARTAPHPYGGARVWLDVGDGDGFRFNDRAIADGLRAHGAPVTFHEWPGGHNDRYWQAHLGEYAAFYARSLAAC
jgi:enterochelin esterase-like enzyme